jgi:diguanylate cyclase (GGDEF)-like protein
MRVVLVDPSRTVQKIVTRMLEARDHEVRAFTEGREALAYIKADAGVGALVTSAELISMSGMELCWEARLLASCRRPIYIVLMSSNYDRHSLIEALDSGADDFIGKPPVPEELYARLRAAERLALLQGELIRMATTDPLTAMPNRRGFFERAQEACAKAGLGRPLSAVMVDIDHFKQINDTYGHEAGDEAIRGVARAVMAESGIAGRLGGEEFALLLDGRRLSEATGAAERLRRQLEAMRIDIAGRALSLTCSFGASEWQCGDTIDHLLRRADAALYAAKTGGRNRVVAADVSLMANYSGEGSVVRSSRGRGDASPATLVGATGAGGKPASRS